VSGGEPDAKPVKRTFRADDGLEIVREVRGQGDTALVFLHGWCGDREYWKHQAPVFAADYRVVALDQAGHGESGKLGGGRKAWTADGLAGDALAVVKALGLKRLILVGHSMAGWVALLAAKRMPGTVVAVIGVDTLQNAEFKLPEEVRKPILDGALRDFKGTVRATFDGQLPEKTDDEVKKWLKTKAEGQDPKMALALMRDLFGLDTRKLLTEAKVPVRCINSAGHPHGRRDQQEVRRLRCDNPRSCRPLPDAGEAGRVQPQTPGRAQGVCDQEVSPSRRSGGGAKNRGHEEGRHPRGLTRNVDRRVYGPAGVRRQSGTNTRVSEEIDYS
jgi:pimeloyl-ACP methyl ester carboxylesterase